MAYAAEGIKYLKIKNELALLKMYRFILYCVLVSDMKF